MPALHFVVLGALLHGGVALWRGAMVGAVHVDAADLQRLQREWRAETGRAPTSLELRASLRRYLDDEILLAEALRLGFDASDAVARARLLQNVAFAFPDDEGDDEARLEQARTLGMPASDLVVRRRLIQLMEHRLAGDLPIDDAELRRYVTANVARYAPATRLSFRQVYFSRDARGAEAARAQAQAVLPVLRAGLDGTDDHDAATLGEPFLHGSATAQQTPDALARRYGPSFARALADAVPGQWIGPLETAYGWHLVRVDAREAAGEPDFAAVRARAAYAWRAEQEHRALQEKLQPLRRRYGVASVDDVLIGLDAS